MVKKYNLKKALWAMLFAYIAFASCLYFFQKSLQYSPDDNNKPLKYYNLNGFGEEVLKTPDGLNLVSWYKKSEGNQKTIIYFHGNAGSLANRIGRYQLLAKNFGVLAVSYRGYYLSDGEPGEKGFFIDAKTAYDFLKNQNIKDEDIILYGESIGSGVASYLSQNKNFAAIILESPFSSILDVAKTRYPIFPIDLMLKDKFRSDLYVLNSKSPFLIFHGTKDRVVEYDLGRKLFQIIPTSKKLITVQNAGHIDFRDEFILTNVLKFVQN